MYSCTRRTQRTCLVATLSVLLVCVKCSVGQGDSAPAAGPTSRSVANAGELALAVKDVVQLIRVTNHIFLRELNVGQPNQGVLSIPPLVNGNATSSNWMAIWVRTIEALLKIMKCFLDTLTLHIHFSRIQIHYFLGDFQCFFLSRNIG